MKPYSRPLFKLFVLYLRKSQSFIRKLKLKGNKRDLSKACNKEDNKACNKEDNKKELT